MAKLPNPRLPLPAPNSSEIRLVEEGTRIWRVYRVAGSHPMTWSTFRHFGPVGNGRFDHQEPPPHADPARGILYGALDAPAAIAEAFQDTRVIDRYHNAPWLVCAELELDTLLLDLRGPWPTRAGASQAISSGRRDRARAWSRAIYAASPTVQGLLYASAMAGASTNVALYERAADSLPGRPILNIPLSHPGLEAAVNRVADRFGYGLR